MLSYRHAFHAGNHADVLKHLIEIQLLRYLERKEKPFWYIDTHAGAGCYALDSGYAAQNAEYKSGIARLWDRVDLPAPLEDYVALVKRRNPDGELKLYPGSPLVAFDLLRKQDKMRLFELHPTDSEILQRNLADQGSQVLIQTADGLAGLKALLPPPPRRALVLIDPSYEVKHEYQATVETLREALKRFATGTYAVWYPRLERPEARQLPDQLKMLRVKSWLHVVLNVYAPRESGFGMYGSGMFVINPPWVLHGMLQEVVPYLVKVLGQDGTGDYVLEFEENAAAWNNRCSHSSISQ